MDVLEGNADRAAPLSHSNPSDARGSPSGGVEEETAGRSKADAEAEAGYEWGNVHQCSLISHFVNAIARSSSITSFTAVAGQSTCRHSQFDDDVWADFDCITTQKGLLTTPWPL